MKRITLLLCVLFSACGEKVPVSLAELKLPARNWSAEQQKLAAKVVLQRSYVMEATLEKAAIDGDAPLANAAYMSALNDFGIWHAAEMYADLEKPYRHCMLMIQNEVDAADQLTKGAPLNTSQIGSARTGCKAAIG